MIETMQCIYKDNAYFKILIISDIQRVGGNKPVILSSENKVGILPQDGIRDHIIRSQGRKKNVQHTIHTTAEQTITEQVDDILMLSLDCMIFKNNCFTDVFYTS